MTDAIAATLLSYKTVPTRKVFQMVLELPIEKAADAIKLFGTPDSDGATWLAVARLIGPDKGSSPPVDSVGAPQGQGKVRHFKDMNRSQQAAIMCRDDEFQSWMGEIDPDGAPAFREGQAIGLLKQHLGIVSRRELDTDPAKAKAWDSLLADFEYRDAVR